MITNKSYDGEKKETEEKELNSNRYQDKDESDKQNQTPDSPVECSPSFQTNRGSSCRIVHHN